MAEPGSLEDLRSRAPFDAEAQTALGLALLNVPGGAANAGEGFAAIAGAARRGEGQALALMATFAAGGVNQEASWDEALRYLHASAEAGWAAALREVAFLGGARREHDLAWWFSPPAPKVVKQSPRIGVIEGFLPPHACDYFIARGEGQVQPAAIYDVEQRGARMSKERTNSDYPFGLFQADTSVCLLQARIEAATGVPLDQFEAMTLMHYGPGQEFTPHYDFMQVDQPGMAADLQRRGQRVLTFLVYLNDNYEGGETEFPRADFVFKGKRGDALMFANVDARGAPDVNALHAGRPPKSGEKWIISQWVRNRPQGW